MATHKGLFKPKNPKKYQGTHPIRYLSWWEFICMRYFDASPEVRTWASESLFLYYFRAYPVKKARYYPDFIVEWKDGSIEMIEVKPLRETLPPKHSSKKRKSTLIQEAITYETNQRKFAAAREFCSKNNMRFRIYTENDIETIKKKFQNL